MEKSGWLLEVGSLCIGLCRGRIRFVTFTDPKAIVFSSKEKADEYKKENNLNAITREHLWSDGKKDIP